MSSEPILTSNCVYIIKTGKDLYKIGKTQDLQKRLASYHTHLPVLFRVVRQYPATNMHELEESLHIVFQHKRVKGEWFRLAAGDLHICDNIARNYAWFLARGSKRKIAARQQPSNDWPSAGGPVALLGKLQRQTRTQLHYSDNPLLQVMEANEKYLRDYSHIAADLKLGLSVQEIVELHEGSVSKATIATVRRLLDYQTPNSQFLSQWFDIITDLEAGDTEDQIIAKHPGEITRNTIRMIRRILRNQLF